MIFLAVVGGCVHEFHRLHSYLADFSAGPSVPRTRLPISLEVFLGDVWLREESTPMFLVSICHLFFSLCDRPIDVSLSQRIPQGHKDGTFFSNPYCDVRQNVVCVGLSSKDCALALCGWSVELDVAKLSAQVTAA